MNSHTPPTLLIIGFGYSAEYIAPLLAKQGFAIIGTSRQEDRRNHYSKQGYQMVDFPSDDITNLLPSVTHLLISTPPLKSDQDPMLEHYSTQLKEHASALRWIGYLSTTGVYGDHRGNWVDENTTPTPINERSIRRLNAENEWLSLGQSINAPTHIFRIAGIYGKDRNILDQLRAGTAKRIDKPNQFFCRIHVEDIAQCIKNAIDVAPETSTIFNLCDDYPCSSREVVEFGANLLDTQPPPLVPFKDAHLSPMAQEFYRCSRRVKNDRIKHVLQVQLQYPTYKEGLHSLL